MSDLPEKPLEESSSEGKDNLPVGEEPKAENEEVSFFDEPTVTYSTPTEPDGQRLKRPKRLSLLTFVISTVAFVLAAVMTTYTLTAASYKRKLAQVQKENAVFTENGYPIEVFKDFVAKYSLTEGDEETRMAAALTAYIRATGDEYAYYYTPEEYAEYQRSAQGLNVGMGINFSASSTEIDGETYLAYGVFHTVENGPAMQAGIKKGDMIYGAYVDGVLQTANRLSFSGLREVLSGNEGEVVEVAIYRPSEGKTVRCSVTLAEVVADSVIARVHSTDSSVGIVQILSFDYVTPKQFRLAMAELIESGCTSFVFDVRGNGGGDLKSVQSILGLFLREGDVTIRTVYKDESRNKIETVTPVSYTDGYEACSLSREEIGMYRDKGYKFTVLCGGGTASAAELFAATFRDYGLGTLVGEKTYGKGSMQTIFSLIPFGYDGAIKLTVAKYYSGANGGMNDGYDGVGLIPDITVSFEGEAANKSVFLLEDSEDTQLCAAVEALKK